MDDKEFWTTRFNAIIDYDIDPETAGKRREYAATQADLDLAEFRKRFGGELTIKDLSNALAAITPDEGESPYLYPWELLPDWVMWCATDKSGTSVGYNHEPEIADFDSQDQWVHSEGYTDCMYSRFTQMSLDNIPTPDWRTSLEERPKEFRK